LYALAVKARMLGAKLLFLALKAAKDLQALKALQVARDAQAAAAKAVESKKLL
jgi:hypothetical protein